MDLALFCSIGGTISLLLVYWYLYIMYHERYMGMWIASWLGFALRIVLFDSGLIEWKESIAGFIIFQAMYVSTILLFLWSACLFSSRPYKQWWIYGGSGSFILSIIFKLLHLPIIYIMAPSAFFAGVILIYIGRIFMYNLQINGLGNYIAGYSFIIWGIFTIIMPYSSSIATPWPYLICGVLRLIIASGTLMVFFEKTRFELINKEAQYRLLVENSVDVIYRYSLLPEPRFDYISPAITKVTGYCPEEFYADAVLLNKLIHPDDLPQYTEFISHHFHSKPFTFRLTRKDRNMIWIELEFIHMYAATGAILARQGIFREVTARIHSEQLAVQNERLNIVGQMAVSFAHEIRNPLTTVCGYLQILSRKKQECSSCKERFALMIKELNHASAIISEYLLLAQDKQAERKKCCLNTIIEELFPLIQGDAIVSNVAINLNLKSIPQLYLDENEIRKLLLNLVKNGVEAMPKGGNLTIGTNSEKDKVVLSVGDQGVGIPIKILENLGKPFLTTKDMGMGLGLPICYRIANRHNATIDVKTGDRGTTFFICFSPSHCAA